MKVVSIGGTVRLMLTDDPPENHCRPAVDYLMRSVAEVYGAAALGVIMTGMGADGKLGVQADEAAGLDDPGPGRGDQRGLWHADGGDQIGGGGSGLAAGESCGADRAVGGALSPALIE